MVVVVANIMTALKLIGRRNVISVTLLNVMCLNLSLLCAQHERADNNALKAENDKIRCENIAIRAALKHDICPNCEYPYFDEHKPRIENAHLRDGLERKSTVASKYMGRPISSHLSTLHPMQISPLDLSMTGPSLDFDLLPGSSMHSQSNNLATISDMDKPLMNDIALTAME
ncbi:BnaC04g53910D [Brassica napus]|nr:BnaC04g53910D [Brassica napus]